VCKNQWQVPKICPSQNIPNDDEQQMMDPYSIYNLVTKSTFTLKITKVIAISRKGMLYPYNMANDPDAAIVLDFGRKSLPDEVGHIIAPFYPTMSDMVLVKGEEPRPWLAEIVGIQERAKTVKVLYYEEDLIDTVLIYGTPLLTVFIANLLLHSICGCVLVYRLT